jgi:septal ring factor EnvC (AmiA/AmiB activator)
MTTMHSEPKDPFAKALSHVHNPAACAARVSKLTAELHDEMFGLQDEVLVLHKKMAALQKDLASGALDVADVPSEQRHHIEDTAAETSTRLQNTTAALTAMNTTLTAMNTTLDGAQVLAREVQRVLAVRIAAAPRVT